jgi:hypothetical protein
MLSFVTSRLMSRALKQKQMCSAWLLLTITVVNTSVDYKYGHFSLVLIALSVGVSDQTAA